MADISQVNPKLLAYWGTVSGSVYERATTAQLWSAVKAAAENDGADLSGVNIMDMNTLRSIAGQLRTASESFDKLAGTDTITSAEMARNVNSTPMGGAIAAPVYQVRFQQVAEQNGELQSIWRTIEYHGALPSTKDMLLADANALALYLAEEYNMSHVDIGAVEISVI